MIYETPAGYTRSPEGAKVPRFSYVISDEGGWLPGSFATRAAAEKALTLPHDKMVELNELINIGLSRDIQETDLQS